MARLGLWPSFFLVLLVGSVALVFWYESVTDPAIRRAIEWVDLALVAVFLVEWVWRVAKDPRPARWALRHSWELLGMIPIILPLPGFLRAIRLLRALRLVRVVGRIGEQFGAWERIARESSVHKIGILSGSLTAVGATLVWLVERAENPALSQFPDALWWAIVTVTTVGYGDVTPISAIGRFVAAMLMVTGIGTIGMLASSVASVLTADRRKQERDAGLGAPGLAGQLQAVAELHRSGALDDEEYATAKARLLGK